MHSTAISSAGVECCGSSCMARPGQVLHWLSGGYASHLPAPCRPPREWWPRSFGPGPADRRGPHFALGIEHRGEELTPTVKRSRVISATSSAERAAPNRCTACLPACAYSWPVPLRVPRARRALALLEEHRGLAQHRRRSRSSGSSAGAAGRPDVLNVGEFVHCDTSLQVNVSRGTHRFAT